MLRREWLAGLMQRQPRNASSPVDVVGRGGGAFFTSRFVWRISLAIILAYTAWAAVRAYPFIDDIDPIRDSRDDWWTYKENALSIVRDGLLMPRVSGAYAFPIPGGFLYNYFVAAVFTLAGPNPAYVYVVQGALLGLGIAVMTLAAASSLPLALRVAYALTLGVYMGIDTLHINKRLLSENLVFLLLPVGVALALRLRDRPSLGYWAGTGAVWGLVALTRPNTVLLGPVLALFAVGAVRSRRLAGPLVAFLLAFTLVFSLWPLRNLLEVIS